MRTWMHGVRLMVAAAAALVLVAGITACGGGGDDDDSGGLNPGGGSATATTASGGGGGAVSSRTGSCTVRLSGDVTGEFTGPGDSGSVGTDYWLSDEEMRKAFAYLYDDDKDQIDAAMAEDPRIFLLIVNCDAGDVSISFLPSGESKYADVPFKTAAEYPIEPGAFTGDHPGVFNALISMGDASFVVSESGTLKLTRFDETGIAGTFAFKMEELFAESGEPDVVDVSGEFEFPCSGGAVCR